MFVCTSVVVVHKTSDGEATPPPAIAEHSEVPVSTEQLGGGENLLSTTPHANLVDGLTPEPKRAHRNTVQDEQRAAQIKALNKKINCECCSYHNIYMNLFF